MGERRFGRTRIIGTTGRIVLGRKIPTGESDGSQPEYIEEIDQIGGDQYASLTTRSNSVVIR